MEFQRDGTMTVGSTQASSTWAFVARDIKRNFEES